jgi:hypothetical protein
MMIAADPFATAAECACVADAIETVANVASVAGFRTTSEPASPAVERPQMYGSVVNELTASASSAGP